MSCTEAEALHSHCSISCANARLSYTAAEALQFAFFYSLCSGLCQISTALAARSTALKNTCSIETVVLDETARGGGGAGGDTGGRGEEEEEQEEEAEEQEEAEEEEEEEEQPEEEDEEQDEA